LQYRTASRGRVKICTMYSIGAMTMTETSGRSSKYQVHLRTFKKHCWQTKKGCDASFQVFVQNEPNRLLPQINRDLICRSTKIEDTLLSLLFKFNKYKLLYQNDSSVLSILYLLLLFKFNKYKLLYQNHRSILSFQRYGSERWHVRTRIYSTRRRFTLGPYQKEWLPAGSIPTSAKSFSVRVPPTSSFLFQVQPTATVQ
jgi:hypothetical protein